MVAVGPIYPVTNNRDEFGGNRKQMLAMEGQLINDLDAAGYNVVNKINGTGALDDSLWQQVRAEFALHFPKLANPIH
ncbi:MAG: hypothetical protein F4W95_07115 [Chloroflexi bacterium]|nr:hypothetical protein [Chloroflexota bacterium]